MPTVESHNPDVLLCLANLSSDEVFTPPDLANQVLDLLPAELWRDPNARFLDPACKSGVFLREITRRLEEGLRDQIPDRQERVSHILKNQVFGIAITELTALLSRRSVYCSKTANGQYSVCTAFDTEDGNIRFRRVEHTWQKGRCKYCGANQAGYERGEALETHAYEFIHSERPEEIFDMQFDVIVSNPPYQLNVGVENDAYAVPIYQHFVNQAKKLNPRYMSMIIPARWYAGGRGLDEFRREVLSDPHFRVLADFPDATICFPGVDISGGVCYFLWDRDSPGDCTVTNYVSSGRTATMQRCLTEHGMTLVRFNSAVPILRKTQSAHEPSFDDLVSPQTPFGIVSSFADYAAEPNDGSVKIYTKDGIGYVHRSKVTRNAEWIDTWKVYIAKSYGERGPYPYFFLAKPFLGEPGTCCTQTYLHIGPFGDKDTALNVIRYIRTRFFRFLVMLKRNTQDAMRDKYAFVPIQDFSKPWTDEELYKKYGLTQDEIAFIESMVRPMEPNGE